jgi:hypothetical protein
MNNVITVFWKNQSNIWWNEICAKIMEHFGLPGHRYSTKSNEDSMKFLFKEEKDAILCLLLIGEYL